MGKPLSAQYFRTAVGGPADDFDLYVINSPETEDRTFAHNAAKEEKEPKMLDAARWSDGCFCATYDLDPRIVVGLCF